MVIAPDPTYSRCRMRTDNRTINNGVSLMSPCQQAHEETMAVLYSTNTIYFDDAQHGSKVFEIEDSKQCQY